MISCFDFVTVLVTGDRRGDRKKEVESLYQN